jgi:hypothetical protein
VSHSIHPIVLLNQIFRSSFNIRAGCNPTKSPKNEDELATQHQKILELAILEPQTKAKTWKRLKHMFYNT